jgi:hypothetical protein
MEYIFECIDIGIKAAVGQTVVGLLVIIFAILAMFVWALVFDPPSGDNNDDRHL